MSNPSSTAIPRFWREDSKERMEEMQARMRLRAILLRLALGLVLIGAMLAMLTWIRPATKPSLVALWVAAPQAQALPPTTMAVGDLESLERDESFTNPRETIVLNQGKARWESQLNELKAMGRVQSLVVYVRALAAVGAAGSADHANPGGIAEVMVLPADADPNDSAAWVPLRESAGVFLPVPY